MSYAATAVAWATIRSTPTLTPPQCLVLLDLADRMNGDDRCWPTVSQIAADTHIHTVTVRKALGALARLGLIIRRPVLTAAGANTHNDYCLGRVAQDSGEGSPRLASPEPEATLVGEPTATPSQPVSKLKPVNVSDRTRAREHPAMPDEKAELERHWLTAFATPDDFWRSMQRAEIKRPDAPASYLNTWLSRDAERSKDRAERLTAHQPPLPHTTVWPVRKPDALPEVPANSPFLKYVR